MKIFLNSKSNKTGFITALILSLILILLVVFSNNLFSTITYLVAMFFASKAMYTSFKIEEKAIKIFVTKYDHVNAHYWHIPCYFVPDNNMLQGRNLIYDILVSIAIWIDVHIFRIEDFSIYVEQEED